MENTRRLKAFRDSLSIDTAAELQQIFKLKRKPKRLEAIDVAHISGTGYVTAAAVFIKGSTARNEYFYERSNGPSELAALGEFAGKFYSQPKTALDILLIDGGQPQLNAASKCCRVIESSRSFPP